MFEGFTFDQKKVDAAADPDVENDVSPKDHVPADWQRPNAAALAIPTSTPHLHRRLEHAPEPIDTLVVQMSEQSLLSNLQCESHVERWILNNEPATIEHPPIIQSIQETMPPEPHAQTRTSVAIHPSESLHSQPLPTSNTLETDTTCNVIAPVVTDLTDPERQMDMCSTSNTFNPRAVRESLMELMITRGLQCNVQNPTPATPVLLSRPSLPSMALAYGLGDDGPMAGDDPMSLEVDEGYDEQDDDLLLSSLVSLRQAGAPGGIPRRSGGLRYRRSAELAMQSKNLRHNTLKMRKRSRPKLSATTPPLTEAPTDASMNAPCT